MPSLADVNAMSAEAFVAAFGDIAEDSPWVAAAAAAKRPFASREAMIAAFATAVTEASQADRLALLRAHPDLAGRAALAGGIGAESASEQAGAGLDRLTQEDFARFTALNQAYRDRFGFSFILAVRGATSRDILAAFEARIGNAREREFATAIEQVCRIMRFRLEDRLVSG